MAIGDLIRSNAADPERRDRVLLRYQDWSCTFAEYYTETERWAHVFLHLRRPGPFHVGILLDNVPDYFFALGGAALAGAVVSGINNTKRGAHLAHDIAYTDCQMLVTEEKYLPLLAPVLEEAGLPASRVVVTRRWQDEVLADSVPTVDWLDAEAALQRWGAGDDPQTEVGDKQPFILIFTSGTITAPKAVLCSHGRMLDTGRNIGLNVYELRPGDGGYIAMPMFHANALMCGWMPAMVHGVSLGMIRRFSKSRWLSDIRRYGATYFNYTGKPLAYILGSERHPDDADNPLRICFGNEGSHQVVSEFEARFGCRVIDVFGSSEGGVGVTRQPGDPPNSIGMPAFGILVVDESGKERPRARFDAQGRLLNAEDAVGEMVNTQGLGWFEGYYKNDDAMQDRTRGGWYWTGDLGYKDEQGYLYFAGRTIEWLRVDGENFIARPVEEILQRHAEVTLAAVYGVPDPDGGDRVMAALILRDGAVFDPAEFAKFLASQPDLSPKWLPTYVRVARELPQTATAKILKTELRQQKFRPDRCADPIWWRPRAGDAYRVFGAADFETLRQQFAAAGRGGALEM